MLAWSEELITDVRKPEIMVMTSLLAGGYLQLLDHLAACHAKPLKSTGAGRYQLLSRWWDAYRKRRPEDFSPKSQGTLALQQIKERGALPMIDRGDIVKAIS